MKRGLLALGIAALIAILVGGVIGGMVIANRAYGHDFWINNSNYKSLSTGEHCCGENDCQPLAIGEVARVEGGWLIKATGETIPDADTQMSEDPMFWRCKRYDGSRRCFFRPAPGS